MRQGSGSISPCLASSVPLPFQCLDSRGHLPLPSDASSMVGATFPHSFRCLVRSEHWLRPPPALLRTLTELPTPPLPSHRVDASVPLKPDSASVTFSQCLAEVVRHPPCSDTACSWAMLGCDALNMLRSYSAAVLDFWSPTSSFHVLVPCTCLSSMLSRQATLTRAHALMHPCMPFSRLVVPSTFCSSLLVCLALLRMSGWPSRLQPLAFE